MPILLPAEERRQQEKLEAMPADGDKLRVCIHVRLAGSLYYTTEVGRLIQSISLAMKVVGLEHSHHTLLGPWLLYF